MVVLGTGSGQHGDVTSAVLLWVSVSADAIIVEVVLLLVCGPSD